MDYRLRNNKGFLLFFAAFPLFCFFSSVYAQRSNDAIAKQIRSLKAEKNIELTYDESANTSKVMARAENFDAKEASKAGIQAMNFAMAFFYGGKTLTAAPETINLTFWVLTKKPQFAAAHNWVATIGTETVDLGEARYAAKPGESMEYLNFRVKREDIAKLAAGTGVRFKLGTAEFTVTAGQTAMFRNIITISDTR